MKVNNILPISSSLKAVGQPVAYFPKIAKAVGSVKASIFLCQFIYWEGKQSDKDGWIYKTMDEIYEETGLSEKEQRGARKILQKLGILSVEKRGIPAKNYYKFNWEKLDEIVSKFNKEKEQVLTQWHHKKCQKGTTGDDKREPLYTENTTEITTENNIYSSQAAGFEKISFSNHLKEVKTKSTGATYEWQDLAVRLWDGIGLKGRPSPSFFKLVKKAVEAGKRGLLFSAYSYVVDAQANDQEKMFYWKFNNLLCKK